MEAKIGGGGESSTTLPGNNGHGKSLRKTFHSFIIQSFGDPKKSSEIKFVSSLPVLKYGTYMK